MSLLARLFLACALVLPGFAMAADPPEYGRIYVYADMEMRDGRVLPVWIDLYGGEKSHDPSELKTGLRYFCGMNQKTIWLDHASPRQKVSLDCEQKPRKVQAVGACNLPWSQPGCISGESSIDIGVVNPELCQRQAIKQSAEDARSITFIFQPTQADHARFTLTPPADCLAVQQGESNETWDGGFVFRATPEMKPQIAAMLGWIDDTIGTCLAGGVAAVAQTPLPQLALLNPEIAQLQAAQQRMKPEMPCHTSYEMLQAAIQPSMAKWKVQSCFWYKHLTLPRASYTKDFSAGCYAEF